MADQLLINLKAKIDEAIASDEPKDFADDVLKILFAIDARLTNHKLRETANALEKNELMEFLEESKKFQLGKFEYYIDDGGISRLFLKTEMDGTLNAVMSRGVSDRGVIKKWLEMGAEEVFPYRYTETPELKIH